MNRCKGVCRSLEWAGYAGAMGNPGVSAEVYADRDIFSTRVKPGKTARPNAERVFSSGTRLRAERRIDEFFQLHKIDPCSSAKFRNWWISQDERDSEG